MKYISCVPESGIQAMNEVYKYTKVPPLRKKGQGNCAHRFHSFLQVFKMDFLKIPHIYGKEWPIKAGNQISPILTGGVPPPKLSLIAPKR